MKFEFPQLTVLVNSTQPVAYGAENPYHCTFKACCFQGK